MPPAKEAIGAQLSSPPPSLESDEIRDLAAKLYGLSGDITPLTSERDQNFLLRQDDGIGLVLKISNASEPLEMTEFQVQALLHLEKTAPGLSVPRMLAARTGAYVCPLGNGSTFRVLTYLEGIPQHRTARTPGQKHALGKALALLTEGLQRYHHPASDHFLQWDIKHAHRLPALIPAIGDAELRELSSAVIADFSAKVLPILASLPTQVVHADLNPHNVLVAEDNPDQIKGILDFGDMVKTPRICDVAVAASYLVDSRAPIESLSDFLAGYGSILPLTKAETDCLLNLTMARMVTTLAITSWRAERQPQNAAYILRNFPSAETGLRALCQVDPAEASTTFHAHMQRTAR